MNKHLYVKLKKKFLLTWSPNSIQYVETFSAPADGKSSDTIVKLTCYFADFKGELCPDAEIEEIDFIGYENRALCSLGSIKVMEWLKNQQLMS